MTDWLVAARALRDEIMRRFLEPHSRQLVTYSEHFSSGSIPTPDEARSGVPVSTGYSTGTEDGALRGGALLAAMCDEYDLAPDDGLREQALRVFSGLQRAQYAVPEPGFVPRWVLSDGRTCYSDSSGDQHTILVYGLWRFCRSALADVDRKLAAGSIVGSIITRIRNHGWRILALGGGDAHAGGGLDRVRLLALLAAAHEITGVRQWRELYTEYAATGVEPEIALLLGRGPGTPPWWGFYGPEQFSQLLTMLVESLRGDTTPFVRMRTEIGRRFLRGPIPTPPHTPEYTDRCRAALGDAVAIETPFDALAAFRPELLGIDEDRGWREDYSEWSAGGRLPEATGYIRWWLGKRPGICHERNCIISPMVAFHICLLSGDAGLIEQVRGPIEAYFEHVELTRANKLGSLTTAYATAVAMARIEAA